MDALLDSDADSSWLQQLRPDWTDGVTIFLFLMSRSMPTADAEDPRRCEGTLKRRLTEVFPMPPSDSI